ncbi:ribbon-helix-helix domain-containing protein [Rhodospirillum rubrum]|uniref:Ribbon-helix-helix domain-containing protein n=1 Tax=Rhodospirillum rubrum (strain ATCC 11170 / ATH 1.1.1 / DSM 467 / LMG 4362 / NCIMB 8255 / S1) TaxID=269796 RepID=Q2RS87_RHORT|nr:ribbon-helix-helix domain-containing protein [Rhodospirillum rubrum]ABC23008.1 conserved hypothetical protein [Rhodospirillum rubrum ATCC 11170]AEO48737.1 hypothetical protein F11_11365 [Rhodospirillum rubrum F11]MBK5954631.1 aryl-sulfate sulfotransferase [Rhodospirillum rubrum]QXG78992.1 ribbon-helix-helix domain-containing protein [Rhodospirillum rubrum]HAQ00174.1 aryl-sulfate sulfotransferase [Rhodospirillum rubrum]
MDQVAFDPTVRKRSVTIAGHRTSVSLEEPFWDALKDLAKARGQSVNDMVTEIDAGRSGNLSSAIRIKVLEAYREAPSYKESRRRVG